MHFLFSINICVTNFILTYSETTNKGQAEKIYTLYRKSPLKQENLSTKDKMAGPEKCHYLRGSPQIIVYTSIMSNNRVVVYNITTVV